MEKKKKKVSSKVWFTAGLASIVVIISMTYVYFYYRVPVYRYPKTISSYELDRKFNQTPDSTLSAFLRAVYTNDADLCRAVVPNKIFNDYGVDYYYGIFNDAKIQYLLDETNKKYKAEYGDDWFEKMEVTSAKVEPVENSMSMVSGSVEANVNGKEFKWDNALIGFDDRYEMNLRFVKEMFDPIMTDESKRPQP
ncbi:MAG: hypothetical protein MR639_08765 [Clostridium sp.]|uniref:hypothetical protein n=1 Tax=Clostridium sp. TaxID=1506 RepID=UPI002A8B6B61|nr:hypothetical protein [Clostridium sp.]MDY5099074.1 hypothetical protein [Clostridium sp.]